MSFTFDSIRQTTKVQEALIKNNFEYFNCKLIALNSDKNKQALLEKAVNVSREKANTLALAAGRKLGKIVKIMEADDTDPTFRNYHYKGRVPDQNFTFDSNELNDIKQSVSFQNTVKVIYELE
ncbi:MAG: SIMPL domain-containing protein [Bacteroidetes bacterium]|nr:SIMPL domain-containing protein [Bacteroidota bacterium]